MAVVDVRAVYGTTIKQYFIGASTDSKPTDVPVGAKFLESDTNTTYIFGSDKTWVIDPEHQSLNKIWNADSLEWERMGQPLVNISNASLFVELGSMDVQFNSMNTQLASIANTLDAGITVNMGSVTSAISTLTSVQASTVSMLASLVSLVTIQNSGVVSNNSQMASLINLVNIQNSGVISNNSQMASANILLLSMAVVLSDTSTRVGTINTNLGNISTVLGKMSNVMSGLSNVLSGISNRISALSTAIGSTNVLLASIEAWTDPLAKFGIAFMDTGSATSYYCFQGKTGDWYAMRISNGSYLYYYNSAAIDTGWGSRNTLSYNSFAGMF